MKKLIFKPKESTLSNMRFMIFNSIKKIEKIVEQIEIKGDTIYNLYKESKLNYLEAYEELDNISLAVEEFEEKIKKDEEA